jgi:hypothetical protein
MKSIFEKVAFHYASDNHYKTFLNIGIENDDCLKTGFAKRNTPFEYYVLNTYVPEKIDVLCIHVDTVFDTFLLFKEHCKIMIIKSNDTSIIAEYIQDHKIHWNILFQEKELLVFENIISNSIFAHKKVITYSLWGDKSIYNIGAIENALQAKRFYPDFECWFYVHIETVPIETISALNEFENTKIIYKTGDLSTCKPAMWRFSAIDDTEVEIMMPRDTDSRFLLREKIAVTEWIQSGKPFLIMRDHYWHMREIMAGMFATRKIPSIPSWTNWIEKYIPSEEKEYDQSFLKEYIYPLVKDEALIYACLNKLEEHAQNFTIPHDTRYEFIGEYIDENGNRSENNIRELREALHHN